MRHELSIIKSKCKIPFTHTFSSALNAVKRNMFVLGLRMLLIESFPGFLECTTEEKILHKLLHAKTNLPLGAHIFVSRVCTYIVSSAHTVQSVHTAQCTHCTHTAHSGHTVHFKQGPVHSILWVGILATSWYWPRHWRSRPRKYQAVQVNREKAWKNSALTGNAHQQCSNVLWQRIRWYCLALALAPW